MTLGGCYLKRYMVRKGFTSLIVLFAVSILVFMLMRLTPGDPAEIMAGPEANLAALERIRQEMNLDKPIWVQYRTWLTQTLQGDFGRSAKTGLPVSTELWARFTATLELVFSAIGVATVIGIVVGVAAASRRGSFRDTLVMSGAVVGQSMPVFWLGLLLVYFLALKWQIVPVQGRLPLDVYVPMRTGFMLIDATMAGNLEAFKAAMRHMVLPTLTLSTIPLAMIARMTRANVVQMLNMDYIRTATAKGLGPVTVLYRHALRNALIPVVTVIGMNVGTLLGGSLLTETIFSWPGLGRYLVDAVYVRDYPVIQASVLVICTVFVVVNYAMDLLYTLLNPRVSYDG